MYVSRPNFDLVSLGRDIDLSPDLFASFGPGLMWGKQFLKQYCIKGINGNFQDSCRPRVIYAA